MPYRGLPYVNTQHFRRCTAQHLRSHDYTSTTLIGAISGVALIWRVRWGLSQFSCQCRLGPVIRTLTPWTSTNNNVHTDHSAVLRRYNQLNGKRWNDVFSLLRAEYGKGKQKPLPSLEKSRCLRQIQQIITHGKSREKVVCYVFPQVWGLLSSRLSR